MKVPTKVKVPWREDEKNQVQEAATERQSNCRLRDAARTSMAAARQVIGGTHGRSSLARAPAASEHDTLVPTTLTDRTIV